MKIWLPAIKANSGADVYTKRLSAGLSERGIEAEITWFPGFYEFMPELMRLYSVPKGVDIIHANSWNAAAFINLGYPVVTTVHHLVHDQAFKPYRSIYQAAYHKINVYGREKKAIKKCNAVISVSEYTASVISEIFESDSIVIPNWIDTNKYLPASNYERNRKFTVLIVGNSGIRKGSDLLPAFAQELGDDMELRVTGGLRGKSSDAAFANNIVTLGRLDEFQLIEEYQSCDAVISLSRYEGFGYTALEAMACGKPFFGFKTSGLAEVVPDCAGVLVNINDISVLAQKIRLMSKTLELCRNMGLAGREFVLTKYGGSNIESYIHMYNDTLLQSKLEN